MVKKIEKSKIYGATGSILFGILLLLLLFFIEFSYLKKTGNEENGSLNIVELEQSFGGGTRSGQGFFRPEPQRVLEPSTPQPLPQPAKAPEHLTQNFEESIAMKAATEKKRQEQEQLRQERLRQDELRRQQEENRKREAAAAAERQRKIDAANAAASGAFGAGSGAGAGTGTSSGAGAGTGASTGSGAGSGSGVGSGNSGGHSWSLDGRTLQGNISTPKYTSNVEGTIVVEIIVDKSGTVTEARVVQGSTIGDNALRNECIAAAKRVKFNATSQPGNAYGRITYRFKLN